MSAVSEIQKHMDAELSWIVDETVSNTFKTMKDENGKVKRFVICQAVGKAVAETLIERLEPEKVQAAGLTVEEFARLADDTIKRMPADVLERGSEGIASFAAEACLVYAQARLMGLESPYNPKPRMPYDDYWPFGNEGGFCNPRKLKMMGD